MDPEHKIIKASFFREKCTFTNGVFVKDLGKFGIDLKDIILIDVNFIIYLILKKKTEIEF